MGGTLAISATSGAAAATLAGSVGSESAYGNGNLIALTRARPELLPLHRWVASRRSSWVLEHALWRERNLAAQRDPPTGDEQTARSLRGR
jgi:hypothetical protein